MLLRERAVGIFSNYVTAETALYDLKDKGFLMENVALIGQDMARHAEGTGVKTSDRMSDIGDPPAQESRIEESVQTGAVAGSAVGGLTGLLVGLGAIAIPGVGPVMLAGAMATAIATTLSGNLIGAAVGSLAGALTGLALPEDQANIYSDRVAKGDYLVMVEGNETSIALAKVVLVKYGIDDWFEYEVSKP